MAPSEKATRKVLRAAHTEDRKRSRSAANEVTRLKAVVARREEKLKKAKRSLAAAEKRAK